jgi:hypothetical protein
MEDDWDGVIIQQISTLSLQAMNDIWLLGGYREGEAGSWQRTETERDGGGCVLPI